MAIFTRAATTALVMATAAGAIGKTAGSLDLSMDFLLFDGVAPILYRRAGTKTIVDGIMQESGQLNVPVEFVLRRQLSARTIFNSAGTLLAGDAVFEIPVALFPLVPKRGDSFVYKGETWTYLAHDLATLSTRWRVYARRG